MNDIKLTEKALKEIWEIRGAYCFSDTLIKIKEKGWIVKDELEEAIDNLNNYYNKECKGLGYGDELYDKANKVIELLQKRVKELNK